MFSALIIFVCVFRKYLWLYRILLNNGLVFYATWVTVATALNFAIALTYEWNSIIFQFAYLKALYAFSKHIFLLKFE